METGDTRTTSRATSRRTTRMGTFPTATHTRSLPSQGSGYSQTRVAMTYSSCRWSASLFIGIANPCIESTVAAYNEALAFPGHRFCPSLVGPSYLRSALGSAFASQLGKGEAKSILLQHPFGPKNTLIFDYGRDSETQEAMPYSPPERKVAGSTPAAGTSKHSVWNSWSGNLRQMSAMKVPRLEERIPLITSNSGPHFLRKVLGRHHPMLRGGNGY